MRYALIGCGMISKNHINAALEAGLEIVAFCDLMEQNTKNALELVPEALRENIRCYTDYQRMLAELHPDIVAIALGSGLKRKLSVDCMKAGANVIVEKPIALSIEDADAMIATAKECGVRLCVCHQLRFVPSVRPCMTPAKTVTSASFCTERFKCVATATRHILTQENGAAPGRRTAER